MTKMTKILMVTGSWWISFFLQTFFKPQRQGIPCLFKP